MNAYTPSNKARLRPLEPGSTLSIRYTNRLAEVASYRRSAQSTTRTITLWLNRSSVSTRPSPSDPRDPGKTGTKLSTPPLEYVDWFNHLRFVKSI